MRSSLVVGAALVAVSLVAVGCKGSSNSALIPLSRPPATSTTSTSTPTPIGASTSPTAAQSAALTLSDTAFALHRDTDLLVKATRFGTSLAGFAGALKSGRSGLSALQAAPNCQAVWQDRARVLAAASQVSGVHQTLLGEISQVRSISAALSADRAAVTSALAEAATAPAAATPSAGTPVSTDLQTALATAAADQATANAAITAATASDGSAQATSSQLVAKANQMATKSCG